MKFAKLSLAALAVVGFSSSAMALDMSKVTAKPYVNTKLYYETVDGKSEVSSGNYSKLFDRESSEGQALVQAGATGNFNSCWGYGAELSVADTLGLENQVVFNTRMGNSAGSALTDTQTWISQAYLTFKGCGTPLKNTTFKIGRQYLDTPLAFTENWNLAPNSFDAIVAVNSDIKNVTLVAAMVGKGNGTYGRVTNGSNFGTYAFNGAYAIGALTNFGVPVNLWYYNVRGARVAADAYQQGVKAWWADTNINLMNVAKLGLQYGDINPNAAGVEDTKGGAIKLSGSVAGFNLSAAYSKMDDDGLVALANTATFKEYAAGANGAGGKKTKLYTAGIYADGSAVAMPGSKAYKLAASTATPIGKFTLAYTDCKNDSAKTASIQNNLTNIKETDLIWGTKVLGINTKLILINRNVDDKYANATANSDYFDNDSKHVRVILSKKF